MTPLEGSIFASAAEGKDKYEAERELVKLVNAALLTEAWSGIAFTGNILPPWFRRSNQCVNWTNSFWSKFAANGLPALSYAARTLPYENKRDYQHSVTLVMVRGSKRIFGIDNGSVGKDDHIFDAKQAVSDESLPEDFRIGLKAFILDFVLSASGQNPPTPQD
jgi:hypothetical protein